MPNKQSRRNFLKSTGVFTTVSSLGVFPNLARSNLDINERPEVCARLSGEYVRKAHQNMEELAIYNNKSQLNTELNEKQRYSFREPKFIHPLIVREMLGWLSDTGHIIVGINLNDANDSNRFFGDYEVNTNNKYVSVVWKEEEYRGFFYYHHIATTPSGVEIVFCGDNGGGSTTFQTVVLFSFEYDKALYGSALRGSETIQRTVLKLGGTFAVTEPKLNFDAITYENGLLRMGDLIVPVL